MITRWQHSTVADAGKQDQIILSNIEIHDKVHQIRHKIIILSNKTNVIIIIKFLVYINIGLISHDIRICGK